MSGDKGSRYSFGTAQDWLDDAPPAQATPAPSVDRDELKRKTREAAASVNYVAPSEVALQPATQPAAVPQPAPAAKAEAPPKSPKAKVAKVIEIEAKGKGRPKGERTVQMSVRIRQEHDELIKVIAGGDFTVASIVEEALVAFARKVYEEKRYKRMPLDKETLELAKRVFSNI
ncbi:hypothetical protein [Asticcacaulis sp. W401b]|uniref:hypothetical protein n=1 Tax=Asticcacaulis sp. W401b TaxID=3388666 RepID=UPI003970F0CF